MGSTPTAEPVLSNVPRFTRSARRFSAFLDLIAGAQEGTRALRQLVSLLDPAPEAMQSGERIAGQLANNLFQLKNSLVDFAYIDPQLRIRLKLSPTASRATSRVERAILDAAETLVAVSFGSIDLKPGDLEVLAAEVSDNRHRSALIARLNLLHEATAGLDLASLRTALENEGRLILTPLMTLILGLLHGKALKIAQLVRLTKKSRSTLLRNDRDRRRGDLRFLCDEGMVAPDRSLGGYIRVDALPEQPQQR